MTTVKNKIIQNWESLGESWRFAIIAFVIARTLYLIWSWVILTVQPVAIQNFELNGEPILSVFRLEDSQAYVYQRNVKGAILTFRPVDTEYMLDQQTGSIWKIVSGTAIHGQYANAVLSIAKTSPSNLFPYHGISPYPGSWLAIWQRFDANWYTSVAQNGYGNIPGDDHFPPLFPLLIRILLPVFKNVFLAGVFVSQIATLITLKLLYDLFTQWRDKSTGVRAVLFFMIYPTFFFFFSAYSEPVFLVITLLAFREMHRSRWAWVGFWIFCAISTRLQGVALVVPMFYFAWKDHQLWRKFSYWFGSMVAGFGGLFYLYLRSTQVPEGAVPFVEAEWHARLVPPWETYWYAVRTLVAGNGTFIDILNWSVMTIFIILLVWGWNKIPFEYNLYTAFSILIILIRIVDTQPLISMSRYSLTLFPAFHALSLAGDNPWLRRVVVYSSLLLNLYLSGQFFIWGWVA